MPDVHPMKMAWSKLAAMVAISSAIMFVMMYQLVYSADHLTFSLNRLLASLIMGMVMTIVMVAFMWKMYEGQGTKIAVVALAGIAAVGLFAINRSQALVDDTTFMRAMIPHHSIAINNARKASISDPRVRKLADQIIESQTREIAEMKLLTEDIDAHGSRGNRALPPVEAKVTPDMMPQIKDAVR